MSASGSYRNLAALAASGGIIDGDGLEAGGPLRAVGDRGGGGGGFGAGMNNAKGSRGSMDSLEASKKSSRCVFFSRWR